MHLIELGSEVVNRLHLFNHGSSYSFNVIVRIRALYKAGIFLRHLNYYWLVKDCAPY
jgi:hypothetical protein